MTVMEKYADGIRAASINRRNRFLGKRQIDSKIAANI